MLKSSLMGFFDLFRRKKTRVIDGVKVTYDDNGNVEWMQQTPFGEVPMQINIKQERLCQEQRAETIKNKAVCEDHKGSNTVLVNTADILTKYKACCPISIFTDAMIMDDRGYVGFYIDKSVYEDMVADFERHEKLNNGLSQIYALNNQGIQFEKENRIDEAVAIYEKSIQIDYPASHPYDRLMVIYRRRKDYANEARVIKAAISMCEKVIFEHPERIGYVKSLEKYRSRLLNVEKKIGK